MDCSTYLLTYLREWFYYTLNANVNRYDTIIMTQKGATLFSLKTGLLPRFFIARLKRS